MDIFRKRKLNQIFIIALIESVTFFPLPIFSSCVSSKQILRRTNKPMMMRTQIFPPEEKHLIYEEGGDQRSKQREKSGMFNTEHLKTHIKIFI